MSPFEKLRETVGDDLHARLIMKPAMLQQYAQSEGHHGHSAPGMAVRPQSIQEVQRIVRAAYDLSIPIVAFGAGTSLEGNAASNDATLCIDFSDMKTIKSINPADLLCIVEPGVTREQLNQELRTTGLFFPVDPGADASLGGMVSTRASGTTTLRYGGIRENVLGLKVVLADGTLISTGSRARKSASGYDLTHLFTGSEGTLGLIVEVTLRIHGQPDKIVAATQTFPRIEDAVNTVIATIQSGIPLARMELLDDAAVDACNRYSKLGIPSVPTLFLEFHGSDSSVTDQLQHFVEIASAFHGGTLTTALETEARNSLWKARHQALYAARALVPDSVAWVTDICVPISALADAIMAAKGLIAENGLTAPVLGHVGDGNFHVFFILHPADKEGWEKVSQINEAMIAHALSVGGTCTGEHGIGLGKRHALLREHGKDSIMTMRRIKHALDPHNHLNPGKIFLPHPSESE